jgi:hypothetical protein
MMHCQAQRIKEAFHGTAISVSVTSEMVPTNERETSGKGDFRHKVFLVTPNPESREPELNMQYVHETENKFSRMTVKSGKYKIQLTGYASGPPKDSLPLPPFLSPLSRHACSPLPSLVCARAATRRRRWTLGSSPSSPPWRSDRTR